jgi:hypothetical protein
MESATGNVGGIVFLAMGQKGVNDDYFSTYL